MIKNLRVVLCLLLVVNAAMAEVPSVDQILVRLKKKHPRLLATGKDFAQLKRRIQTDAELKQWSERLKKNADKILEQPASIYEIPDGKRLLATSRRVVDRVYALALAYRLHGDRKYVERAWKELSAAAAFKDWNPSHFLDTAEMTHAFAIGYDWLYDAWTPQQRETLRTALIEKGLKPALASYEGKQAYGWWHKAVHNWNQVCNGGIGIGALAIADEQPELAGRVLHEALKSLPLAMTEYAPDGGCAEGPGYWGYGTSYTVTFLAALESALGTDFGLSKSPGFSETGLFPVYMSAPNGQTFSYADSHAQRMHSPALFWLANKFHLPVCAGFELHNAPPAVLDLLWMNRATGFNAPTSLSLDKYYRHVEVATFRSAWGDTNALFAGFKAGDNKANHSHLDLGSFVLDALGQRWTADIGSDNYNLPGYFGRQRWDYYRLRAEGHNTLVINPGKGPDQNPKAVAPIVKFESKPQRAFAIADLTAAYQVAKVQRGIAMLGRNQVIVQDEIRADAPADVWWFMHTGAKIEPARNSSTVILTSGKSELTARILSPAGAVFTVMEAEPLPSSPNPEKQGSNSQYRKLAIHLPKVTDTRLVVQFSTQPAEAKILPLAEW